MNITTFLWYPDQRQRYAAIGILNLGVGVPMRRTEEFYLNGKTGERVSRPSTLVAKPISHPIMLTESLLIPIPNENGFHIP